MMAEIGSIFFLKGLGVTHFFGKTLPCLQTPCEAYLTDLNGGIEVEDSEVEWVMKESRRCGATTSLFLSFDQVSV